MSGRHEAMRDELKLLIQLQSRDRILRKLKSQQAQFARDIEAARRGAESRSQNVVNRTEEARSFRKALDGREVGLKDIEARVARLDGQLNTVKTNKEYSALQHEIMGLKADASRIEDEILTMLEQADAQQNELKELSQKADEARAAAKKRCEELETGIADAEARLERLGRERGELAEKIPRHFLDQYERLLKRSDGRAMSPCRNFVCGACRMTLTANTVNLLMVGKELIRCHSCGRILYLAEDDDLEGVAGAGRKDY